MTNIAQKYAVMAVARKDVIANYNKVIIDQVVKVLQNELKALILENKSDLTIEFDRYRVNKIIRDLTTHDLEWCMIQVKLDIIDISSEKEYSALDKAKIELINYYIQNIRDAADLYIAGNPTRYQLIEQDATKNLDAVKATLEDNGFTLTANHNKFTVSF